MDTLLNNFRRMPVLLKWVELIVSIVCIGTIQQFGYIPATNLYTTAVVYTAICSYIIILPVVLAGYNMGNEINKVLLLVWSVVGMILSIVAGALLFQQYSKIHVILRYMNPSALIGSGILAILNSCVFAIDILCTYREQL